MTHTFFNSLFSSRSWRSLMPLTEIAITAFMLGFVCCLGLTAVLLHFALPATTATASSRLLPSLASISASPYALSFAAYVLFAGVVFHMSEFLVAAQYRPHDASPQSFMLVHSKAYLFAQLFALCEFACEVFLMPTSVKLLTTSTFTVLFGCLGVVCFYGVRVVSMVQCGANFSLQVEYSKRSEHRLVQSGLYSVFRHPSYFGWFYHVLFSQVILLNPVSLVGFSIVTWYFFKGRIEDEEAVLMSQEFFGVEYVEYRKKTIVGIPFIK